MGKYDRFNAVQVRIHIDKVTLRFEVKTKKEDFYVTTKSGDGWVRIADPSPKRLLEKLGHVQVQWLCTRLDWTYHRWAGRENQDHVMGLSIGPVFPATASLFTRATPHSETDERTQTSCLSSLRIRLCLARQEQPHTRTAK
jgi:hypothetical protein